MMSLLPTDAAKDTTSTGKKTDFSSESLDNDSQPLVIFGDDNHGESSDENEVDNSAKEAKSTKKRILKEKKPPKSVEKRRKK